MGLFDKDAQGRNIFDDLREVMREGLGIYKEAKEIIDPDDVPTQPVPTQPLFSQVPQPQYDPNLTARDYMPEFDYRLIALGVGLIILAIFLSK